MKRWTALLLVSMMMLTPMTCLADVPHITYEQFVSGEYFGQTVEVNAKALHVPYYAWGIEKEDGTFAVVDENESRWFISKNEYEKASPAEKEAIDNGEVFILTVRTTEKGALYNPKFRMQGALSENDYFMIFVIGSIVGIVLLMIFLKIWNNHLRKHPLPPKPVPVKTKFIDSAHTTTRSGGLGRAMVGAAIAGELGAIIGASTSKDREHHTTTFMVYYSDGSHKVETVSNSNYQYKKYMEMLDMGD